ncbi:MAG: MoaD/ThiS family protein [Candidatus Altiarchaeota archaeon]
MAKIRIPTPLQKYTGNQSEITVDGSTISEIIDNIEKNHNGIKEKLLRDGAMNKFINVYVDGEDIRFKEGLATSVGDESEISIIPAISGG